MALTEKKVVEIKTIRIDGKYIPYVLLGRKGCLRFVSMRPLEDRRHYLEIRIKIDGISSATLYLCESMSLNFNFNHQIEIELNGTYDGTANFIIEIYE